MSESFDDDYNNMSQESTSDTLNGKNAKTLKNGIVQGSNNLNKRNFKQVQKNISLRPINKVK